MGRVLTNNKLQYNNCYRSQLEEAYMREPAITHLERRKIEARVLIPMGQAFQGAIGKERADEIA